MSKFCYHFNNLGAISFERRRLMFPDWSEAAKPPAGSGQQHSSVNPAESCRLVIRLIGPCIWLPQFETMNWPVGTAHQQNALWSN